ncbi:hypothetical protein B566_EDAN013668 [Ephemera danica]|nr:hypothetical protein B566_EDAN013668 [Ephemera danica]
MLDMEDETNEKLKQMFKGEMQDWLQVGPKKYTLPNKYKIFGPKVYNFEIRHDDYWIVTFPRSGTTVTQEMIWLLQNDLDYEAVLKIPLMLRFPQIAQLNVPNPESIAKMMEDSRGNPIKEALYKSVTTNVTSLPSAPGPRFFKSHFPLSLLPPTLLDTCKVVYLCRNPKDVAVSYYNLSLSLKTLDFQGDFPQYWDLFEQGIIRYAPYWEHIAEAWEQRNHPNMLFLFYEDLVKDMAGTIRKLTNHYGKQLTDEQVQRLADFLQIDNFRKVMQNMGMNDLVKNEKAEKSNTFIRRGVTGGWKDHFTPELEARADKWIADNVSRIPGFSFPV